MRGASLVVVLLFGVAIAARLDTGEAMEKSALSESAGMSVEDRQKAIEEIDFHSAGVEALDSDIDMASADNETLPNSPSASSGLAWDKHDFEVSNNKGGDVKVEVNLAAPMTSESTPDSGDDDQEDIGEMLRLMTPEDPVNPIQLMSMMKDLMATMKPDEPDYNITEILSEFRASIPAPVQPPPPQDLTPLINALNDLMSQQQREVIQAPPPPPGPNPETIVKALLPPPPAIVQQAPFDVSQFMKELRESMAANKPAPVPPAGTDPALLQSIKDTLNELKALHAKADTPTYTPPPIPTPPPAQPTPAPTPVPQPEPISLTPPPPPPASGSGGGGGAAQEDMREMLKGMLDQIRPPVLPAFPTASQDAALEELRAMIKNQRLQSTRPIILPPPVSSGLHLENTATSLAPPPPPPPTSPVGTTDLQDLIKSMIPAPQRIPAPPKIDIKHEQVACCSQPSPEDNRSEEVRCPRINGIPRPRCKRDQPPSPVVMRCKGGNCGNQDEDGDINVDGSWPSKIPPNMDPSTFNPKKLLIALRGRGE